jgi:hypothetical protein
MYPIKRYFKTLKGFVWNKARLEGSMVEGYALEEALRFYTKYIQDLPRGDECGIIKMT